mmetsp:Transcript_20254/g.36756  ORF Transcript_20254/g.36756 Transcript_20254/m.36756 type:complete len:205 (-) Transcript_20254:83-697(-)
MRRSDLQPPVELCPQCLKLRVRVVEHPNNVHHLVLRSNLLRILRPHVRLRRRSSAHRKLLQSLGGALQLNESSQVSLLSGALNLYVAPQLFSTPLHMIVLLIASLDGLMELSKMGLLGADLFLCICVGLRAELQVVLQGLDLSLDILPRGSRFGLLRLGLVLESYGISLLHRSLHLNYHLFLLSLELIQSQLHPVDLLLHGRCL